MARKKDTPQKAMMREFMQSYLKENDVKIKDGTDVNSIIQAMEICRSMFQETEMENLNRKSLKNIRTPLRRIWKKKSYPCMPKE